MIRSYAAEAGMAGDGEGEERRFDRGVPRLSLRLPDGSRLFAVMAVSRRPLVSIRRHPLMDFDLRRPGRQRHVSTRRWRRSSRRSCGPGSTWSSRGGPNTGKTQTLRAFAKAIPPRERLVTIEDAFELDLDADPVAHPNVAALQAREPNIEGQGGVDMAELVRWGLRMNPDRVIVGEARGARGHPAAQRHVAGQRRVASPRSTPRRRGRRSPAWPPTRCRRRSGCRSRHPRC